MKYTLRSIHIDGASYVRYQDVIEMLASLSEHLQPMYREFLADIVEAFRDAETVREAPDAL